MTEQLGVGIVGTGIMARVHADVLASYHRSSIAAWVSRNPDAVSELERFGSAPAYPTVEELIADDSVQAVVVATPDHLHAEAALTAIAAGRHVLVEKPLATTVADARAIRDAAAAAGVTVMTLFNHRWVPAYWQAHEVAGAGQLGRPVLAYTRKNDTIEVPTEMIAWADQTTPSFFLSSHDLDLLLWYFDSRVVEVRAWAVEGVLTGLGVDTPDAVQAQVRFENGAVATLEACWTYPNTFPTMTDSFIELIFAEGVIHLDRKQEQIEVATTDRYSFPRNLLMGRAGGRPAGAVAGAVRHFVDAALDHTEPIVAIDSSVHVTEVLVAIDKSWRSGSPVALTRE